MAWHGMAQTVALKVSMHCHGCARKVEKQISKLHGRRSSVLVLHLFVVIHIHASMSCLLWCRSCVHQNRAGDEDGDRGWQRDPHASPGDRLQGDQVRAHSAATLVMQFPGPVCGDCTFFF